MHSKIKLLALICFCGLAFSACKSRKKVADRYKYLIKNSDTRAATSDSDSPTAIAGKATIRVIQEAESYLGTPYRYGGINKNGIDCSGLTQKSYSINGVTLPRSAAEQSRFGDRVGRDQLRPGDLVFFSAKNDGNIDHVGLVTEVQGEDVTFIHASSSRGVRHDKLNEGYWRNLYKLARRIGVN
ncbi:MAG: C40 family peptidase [Bacteroidota bacterium]